MTDEPGPPHPSTVIIVGDPSGVAGAFVRLLREDGGYSVRETGDPAGVFALIAGAEPEAIILALPGIDLASACLALKRNSSTQSVPLLVALAESEALPAGVDDRLRIPLDREETLVKVARLTERSRVERRYAGRAPGEGVSRREAGELVDSTDRYRLLFEGSPLPMWVYDLQTLTFLAVNEAALRRYGYTQDEFLSMTIKDIRPPEDVPALLEKVSYLIPGLDMTGTWRHRKKDGSLIDVEITSHELIFAGRRARLVLAHDITERKQAERALAQQLEREALVNRISGAVRRSLDPAEVFRTAVDELGQHLDVDRCILFILDDEAGVLRGVAEYTAPGVRPGVKEYPVELLTELVTRVRHEGVLTFDDVERDARLQSVYQQFLSPMNVRSMMYVAIRVGDEIPAAFAFSTLGRVRPWFESDIALAKAVANQTGIAIKQAELFALVVTAKEEWEATFNAMSDGVLIFNEEGTLTRVNEAGAALRDAAPSDLIGRRCCEILRTTPDECIVTRCLREGHRLTDEVSLEGLGRSLLLTAEPVFAGDGRVAGAVCSVRDLSELRKIEAVAREHQSLLRSVLDSARESIYALDIEGRVQWCNKGVAAMGGYAPEDLIGHHFLEWAHPSEHEALREHWRRALAGEPQSYEMTYFGADGQTRSAHVDNTPLLVNGRTTGVLGIARDNTEQKVERERAAQAEKLRALGQLASGVAHDFNNALAAILGRAQMLGRLIQDATLATHLEVIETAAADAAATVRRIQTFARQPSIKEFELLNLTSLLRDAMELTRTRWEAEANARGLSYDVRLSGAGETYVEGSASELREVFVNLIVNALDAMPAGGTLNISCQRAGDRLRLLFADTGSGITDEVRARIFEPFYTTKGAHGTGLGLFVSYGIVERHGGVISVESEPGRGTVFTIELPVIDHATARPPASRAPAVEEHLPSILVIDDDPYVRETLAEAVSELAQRVVKADGGRAALAAAAVEPFDLIFIDLSMPVMDGWETARQLRRTQPRTKIVLMTGYGQGITLPAGGEGLVDLVIGKPFDLQQVTDIVTQLTPPPRSAQGLIDPGFRQRA